MMNRIPALLFLLFVFFAQDSRAQSPVSVNTLTGTANVTIPVYTMQSGPLELPITLSYAATGVRPRDIEGSAGLGWQLNAGGQILRTVRGLPDDVLKDNSGATRVGWMGQSNTYADAIGSFNISNTGDGNCSNESSDINTINSSFPYNFDNEPDMFYIDVPGLSFQMVFDRKDGKFHPITYQDVTITYTSDPTTGLITAFTIVNDKGVKYAFANSTTIKKITINGTNAYLATQYKQYQNGVTYSDAWMLTSMTDPNGNGFIFQYSTGMVRPSTDPVSLYLPGATTATLQYKINQSSQYRILSNVSPTNANGTGSGLTFTWSPPGTYYTGQWVVNSIQGFGHNFKLNYDWTVSSSGYSRCFLRDFSEDGCSSPVHYSFNYSGETYNTTFARYDTALPDSGSVKIDYWGYYAGANTNSSLTPTVMVNPSNSLYPRYNIFQSSALTGSYLYTVGGNNRIADPQTVMTGTLSKITNVMGGTTTMTYESNDYVDIPSGQIEQGGGIRVKQIIDDPGTGPGSIITRNYSYLNPSGVSSGSPISMPVYAFTIPYSGTATGNSLWTNNTVLSDYDLSPENHTILYGYVTESKTGAGSTQYQYYTPATNWSNSAVPACDGCTSSDWSPTINYVARYNCTSTYGPIKNDINTYPFIPNVNYGFEQGELLKVISYNDAGNKVGEMSYKYQRSFAPTSIAALKSDDLPNGTLIAKAYGKYNIYYNTSELTSSVTQTTFDAANAGQSRTSTVNYGYESAYHKLLTKEVKVNSDNSIITSHFTYSKDYVVTNSSNLNIFALYNLQRQNINVPVETWQEVTRGNTTLTTAASLTLFKPFAFANGSTLYFPSQQLKLTQLNGGSFTPLTITNSSQTISWDSKYYNAINFDSYDNTGSPLTTDDGNKNIQTTITDHSTNRVTAAFKNASANEIAYNDFDTQVSLPSVAFSIAGTGAFTPDGSHSGNAAGLYASSQTVSSPTLSKNALSKNYIFSIWINAATQGALTLTISGLSTQPVINYTTGGWKYYEIAVPASGLSSSFTVSFTSNQSISIDDVLFYPDVAQVETSSYDPVSQAKISGTNTNGVSTYYLNDKWGRLLRKLDQDKNIVERNSNVTPSDQNFSPTINLISAGYVNSPVQLSCYYSPCADPGASVTWDFGDGSPTLNANYSDAVSHTYTTSGDKVVKCTLNSTVYANTTISRTITISTPPPPPPPPPMVTIKYNNQVSSGGAISHVTFVSNSTGTSYGFSGSSLNNAQIPPGSYTVSIAITGQQYNSSTGSGYTCIFLNGDCGSAQCAGYTSSGNYSFNVDVTTCTTYTFTLTTHTCSYMFAL